MVIVVVDIINNSLLFGSNLMII